MKTHHCVFSNVLFLVMSYIQTETQPIQGYKCTLLFKMSLAFFISALNKETLKHALPILTVRSKYNFKENRGLNFSSTITQRRTCAFSKSMTKCKRSWAYFPCVLAFNPVIIQSLYEVDGYWICMPAVSRISGEDGCNDTKQGWVMNGDRLLQTQKAVQTHFSGGI